MPRFTAIFVVMLAGCANANPAIQIETAVTPDMMCTVQITNPRIFHGLYDASLGGAYSEAVVYRNRMVNLGGRNPGPPRAEPDDFTVQGAIVTLQDVDGAQLGLPMAKYRVAASAFIPAATDTMVTEGVGTIEIIPEAIAPDLAAFAAGAPQDIVASVVAYGQTSGGSHVDMDPWIFPLTVCNGCLCGIPPPMTPCHPGADGEGYTLPGGCP